MNPQQHLIKTQVVEMRVNNEAVVPGLQQELIDICNRKLRPLLAQYCDSISHPDAVQRIERLELDVGRLRATHLEADFLAQIKTLLPVQLQTAVALENPATPEPSPKKEGTALEAMAWFLQHGHLPWWSTGQDRQKLREYLDILLTATPEAAATLFRKTVTAADGLKRLVAHFSDEELEKINRLLAASSTTKTQQELLHDWQQIEQQAALKQKRPSLRLALWRVILGQWASPQSQASSPLQLANNWLRESARLIGTTHQQVLQLFLEAATALQQQRKSFSAPLQQALETSRPNSPQAAEQATDLVNNPAGLKDNDNKTQTSIKPAGSKGTEHKTDSTEAQNVALLAPAGAVVESSNAAIPPDPEATLETIKRIQHNPFHATDTLYIENAGLVLLWPFLARFFGTLGWVSENAFIGPAEQEQALLLLQHLCGTPANNWAEPLLPLNKVLCGLPLEMPCNLQAQWEPEAAQQADILLKAVIQNWPALGAMKTGSFQQAWLQRPAALTRQEGNWQLQVEKQTYDILLNKLPWQINIIKLPWMNGLLYVDW